jgi:hypothetical protein
MSGKHWSWVAAVLLMAAAATADDNLKIMNPDVGIFPYDVARMQLSLTKEFAGPGERQSLRVSTTTGGYAGVYRPGVSAVYAWGNWSEYDRVRFWVHNANSTNVAMKFTVKTSVGDKVVNGMKSFTVTPGPQVVTLNLADCLSAENVKPNLRDVTQWLFSLDDGIEQPVYLGSISLLRSAKQLLTDRRPETFGTDWRAPAEVGMENPEAWQAGSDIRLRFRFPAGRTTQVWWTIPRPKQALYQVPEPRNVWHGYEKLAIDFINAGKEPQKCTLYVADLTADFAKAQPEYEKQLARVEFTIPSGRNTVEIPLADMKTPDDIRGLNLNDIRGIGFEVEAGAEPVTLQLDNIRLLTTRDDAGTLPRPAARLTCPICGLAISDQYAQQCPSCGYLYREKPAEADSVEGAIQVPPAGDKTIAGGMDVTGGSRNILGLGHYDSSAYDCRAFIRFDLSDLKLPEGAQIERAELRLYPDGKCGKPYLPPLDVYSVEGPAARWDEKKLTWESQPAPSRWLFTGGLYRPSPKVLMLDLTEYVREKAAGDKSVSLILKATTAGPCAHDNHMMGHFVNVYSSKEADPQLRPCLYIVPAGGN